MSDIWFNLLLFLAGTLTFTLSTLTAGGGGLLLVPILNLLVKTTQAAPVLNTGNLIGRPIRLLLYWKYIDWKATLYYVPTAIVGSVLAASFFAHSKIIWLQFIIGLFLISTLWQYKWGKRKSSFKMTYAYLMPLGLLISFLGTITGASGPVLNPFYLNLGLSKEKLIGTKTANSFFMGLAQIGSYTWFGIMSNEVWGWAVSLGIGISLGSYIGKRLLKKMPDKSFRNWVIGFIVFSGILMIIEILVTLS